MDVFKDKSWVKLRKLDKKYVESLNMFLDYACVTCSIDDKIACPCSICGNRKYYDRETVKGHLLMKAMDADYQKCVWVFHGESCNNDYEGDSDSDMMDDDEVEEDNNNGEPLGHDMYGMIGEAFENCHGDSSSSGQNEEAKTFFKLLQDAGQPLYHGCEDFSKLSFIIEMYNLKCLYGVTDRAFNGFVNLFKRALPKESSLPNSFKKMQHIIKQFGLGYEKIDACPNDCVLFRKDKAGLSRCPECNASRYKLADDGTIMKLASGKHVPVKVLRYFPLIPRLKRLYMSSKTSPLMRWHADKRKDDGKLRHPADSKAWKDFDLRYPEFAKDPRNVRLCLASDGFNPFGNLSNQYSIWPVVLMTYNLPPWLCMKQSYSFLSLLIPGPTGPGNNIDVYLEPLVEELEELWERGVETYDAFNGESFMLRGALHTTINDFPAYSILSGRKTKGKHACPYCDVETSSLYLHSSRKMCYMGHRRFLPGDHAFRRMKKAFDGKTEMRQAPPIVSGTNLIDQLNEVHVTFGKHPETLKRNKRCKGADTPWKKKSIFFRLPYWKHILIRHHLDVMHVEKNVSESILGTLLGIEGKNKDSLQSRMDLKHLNIRHHLHPIEKDGKTYLPAAPFTLSKKEKEDFINILASVKVPDGYASNIKRRIVDGKIYGLKSHDHHVIMQQLLPLVARKMENKKLGAVLIELSSFFKELCSKVATAAEFQSLQDRVVVTLCKLELIFPPSFFDIMVHLVVHLAYEAMITGPVIYHWMYPVERDLRTYKCYVRNKSRPEGSIAEGYIANECLTFCARYLHDTETRENRTSRNNDDGGQVQFRLSVFSIAWKSLSKREETRPDYSFIEEAHNYVLFNCEEVKVYEEDHYSIVAMECQGVNDKVGKIHRERFSNWFSCNVSRHLPLDPCVSEDLKCLSAFPSDHVRKMSKITCNGYKWRIKAIDNRSVTQNSGVLVNSVTSAGDITWFGILTGIFELAYPLGRSIILFQCDWIDPKRGVKKDVHGLTLVNLKARCKTNEPFILASQAVQVFYTPESKDKSWHVAIATKPRDLFEVDGDNILEVDLMQSNQSNSLEGDDFTNVRDDITGVTVNMPVVDASRVDDDASRLYTHSSESDTEDDTLYDYDED